ncbi:DUF6303 family protein [Streptomyces clavuligerus]|uniref:Uncharacterized protein n=1 Tax=Streptomyces clavuligerus TaxID=1901 RepID=B5GL91_STRCL|nr:DUF6303 family protein [Streptomyces clavuligerus]ANW18106.1 hypothetical protein BB341_07655 [Streptomyces clavuligerus]AXU12667.1 hypothetical protein D1794_07945 [Streptomyces clavuligerus]EDY47087.1 hypothetical protein SSCG_00115 [Streptomyces clavuligerus]EFG09304.1 Hypothetical protein SCLAV_4230 [Streptomyces clavuligerus]MBY6302570.1 hypothetical protein [Streptomyces clavuligerus]
MTTYTARLDQFGGGWGLCVVLHDASCEEWPEMEFGRTDPAPTPAERTAALRALGFEVVGRRWAWEELTVPDGPTELAASIEVRRIGGGS